MQLSRILYATAGCALALAACGADSTSPTALETAPLADGEVPAEAASGDSAGVGFVDNETLQLQLVPAASQSPCADGDWAQAPANTHQVVPLCHAWNVRITLSADAPEPLLVGAVVLSSDGATFGLPQDGRSVRLSPGESVIFDDGETFRGTPPLDTPDRVLAFGTRSTADATWTTSSIGLHVEANSRFLKSRQTGPIRPREYTMAAFDIRPYLPDSNDSALRRVLKVADRLVSAAGDDGIPYAQHDWSLPTDEQNLSRGIDCSRGVWYAFTRAGLPFNRDDRYLHTGLMTGESSPMNDEFDACPTDEPHELGDVLVYRSDERGDGHTVMVIDADKRIAWGSMGWDGNAKASDYLIPPDTGVEYQRIKFKPDWQRWDRGDMQLKACWRYRRFDEEADSGIGLPGNDALESVCDPAFCPAAGRAAIQRPATGVTDREETTRG